MYECFGLVLMVTHACNLQCSYCYCGAKAGSFMSVEIGRAAIDRALRSLHGEGVLELGFFGGEPLLGSQRIVELIEYAADGASRIDVQLTVAITTNGTLDTDGAWNVMTLPTVQTTISHDGLPEVHDRYRRDAHGRGTSERVLATIGRLLAAGREVRVNMVVRPDTVARLPEGITWLREQGVRHFDTSLDLWARWQPADAAKLQETLARCADLWREQLPELSISWYDEKAAQLLGVSSNRTARCGFGDGEIAVAPSGNLYPCERLIGEDRADNPMRLPGHVLRGDRFSPAAAPQRSAEGCSECAIQGQCNTTCRCSNYVRTGDVQRPDGLLCMLDQVTYRETARVLKKLPTTGVIPLSLSSFSLS